MSSIAPKGSGGSDRGSGTHRLGADRRRISRVGVELVIDLELEGGRRLAGVALDVGLGGMFIESVEVLAYGLQLTVLVRGGAIRLPAIVRWSSGNGMGVQFGLLGARETQAVADLVEQAKGG